MSQPNERTPAGDVGDVQILVPIRNEDEHVPQLYAALIDAGVAFDELRFLYDSDDDTSLPFVARLSTQDARVHAEKSGLGPGVLNVLRWGFAHVRPGPVIVLMGDCSDDVTRVGPMIERWRQGATIVVASRHMPGGGKQGGPLIKGQLSRWAGVSLRACGFPTSDPTNNFKLYDGAWLAAQEIESRGGFEVALELCCKAFRQGRRIDELPTLWSEREQGASKFRLWSWLRHYLAWYLLALWSTCRRRPSRPRDVA